MLDARPECGEDRRQLEDPPGAGRLPTYWMLETLEPTERRGERVKLDTARGRYRLGRSESCDIRLYTAEASREHADLRWSETGEWLLEPLPGRRVRADGEPLEAPCTLCEGLRIELGGDSFRCSEALAEVADPAPASPPPLLRGFAGRPAAVALTVALGVVWLIFALLRLVGS
jgi:hypothetical protein